VDLPLLAPQGADLVGQARAEVLRVRVPRRGEELLEALRGLGVVFVGLRVVGVEHHVAQGLAHLQPLGVELVEGDLPADVCRDVVAVFGLDPAGGVQAVDQRAGEHQHHDDHHQQQAPADGDAVGAKRHAFGEPGEAAPGGLSLVEAEARIAAHALVEGFGGVDLGSGRTRTDMKPPSGLGVTARTQ
jgi:hypothetical protein